MLLALPALAREGFAVNAHGCRQYSEALTLLRGLASARRVPAVVVIALGGDGSVTHADVAQTLAILGTQRLLVLVTPRELGGGSGSDAAAVREAGRQYPGRVRVLDWVAFAAGHGGWFQPDGLHLTFPGADAFARFLRPALAMAPPEPVVMLSGHAPPAGAQAPAGPVSFHTRVAVPAGWRLSGRFSHAGLPDIDLVTPGSCSYHLRLSAGLTRSPASAGPAAQLQSAIPPGVRASSVRRARGVGTRSALWVAWRDRRSVGGAWTVDLGAAPDATATGEDAILVWTVSTARGGGCGGRTARAVESQLGGLLARLRAS